ncbi:MAG: HD domain-containing protein, partial [Muribaculaceae bacterium]|nr:HD domain-containing protein [Muribaculaceae bacterium]
FMFDAFQMKKELYISITERLRELIRGTEFEGHVLSVGGCVRDDIMGLEIKDIDLAVTLPDGGIQLAEWLERNGHTSGHVVTYPTYHTAMFRLKDFPDEELEAVQTRKEKYNDHSSRNPVTAFGSIEEDCMRRDLTINALYRDISTGEIIDITGHGTEDISHHIIRTPTDPDLTYDDDPLRILRCIRFASRYGWTIEPDTWAGMLRNVQRLDIISRERIRDEFEKMLSCAHPVMAMELLRESGAMHYVIPELEETYEMSQNKYHFGTVWEHTMKVLENISAVTNRPELRLAAVLHDIGKVRTREEKEDGSVHFINHEHEGAVMVKGIMTRLKFPNRAIDNVSFMTRYHMMTKPWEDMRQSKLDRSIRKLQFICGTEQRFDDLMTLIHADNMAHVEDRCIPDQVPFIRKRTEEMIAEGTAMFGYKLWLTGHEIMEIKGIGSDPRVKECQEYMMKLAFVNPKRDKEEVIKHLKGYRFKQS